MSGKRSQGKGAPSVGREKGGHGADTGSSELTALQNTLGSCENQLRIESLRRQAAQEAWELSEERYQSLIEGMEDIVFSVDSKGKITQVNPAVKRALGHSPDHLIGHDLFDYLAEPDRERGIEQFTRVFVTSPQKGEYRALDHLGNAVWFRVIGTPVKTVTGVDGVRCIATEITRERMQHQELVWSRQMAATGQMAVFLAQEIYQAWQEAGLQLASVDNMVKESPEMAPFWPRLSNALSNLPESIHKLASLDPAVDETLRAVNLNQSITNVIRLLRQRFERLGIKTTLSLSTQVPFTMAWPKRMEHAIFALLNHACRAVEEKIGRSGTSGEINVTSRRKKDKIIIELSDNGPGLSREDCFRIFDFNHCREDSATGSEGLHIPWSIITDHGGSIKASASPEGGALFTIELPVRHPGA